MADSLLAAVLSAPVVVEEIWEHPLDLGLFPSEQAVVDGAAEKRRREFAAVRRCARAGLERLGIPEAPILPGAGGAAGWPAGIVGTMTHCSRYAGAALARLEVPEVEMAYAGSVPAVGRAGLCVGRSWRNCWSTATISVSSAIWRSRSRCLSVVRTTLAAVSWSMTDRSNLALVAGPGVYSVSPSSPGRSGQGIKVKFTCTTGCRLWSVSTSIS